MASGSQPIAKRSSADSVVSRERTTGGFAEIRPSRGAEDILAQSRTLFRAMVQMPHYTIEVSTLCRVMRDARSYSCEGHAAIHGKCEQFYYFAYVVAFQSIMRPAASRVAKRCACRRPQHAMGYSHVSPLVPHAMINYLCRRLERCYAPAWRTTLLWCRTSSKTSPPIGEADIGIVPRS